MGTTTKTDQQNQFAPSGMNAYNQTQPTFGQTANQYMSQPFSNPFFQTQQQMGTNQAHQLGGSAMGGLTNNMTATGMLGGGQSPAGMEMLQNQARANTGLQSQLGFLNPVQNAMQQQNFYSNLAANYRPLQTGQNQTQSTGGLGTWLPQVAGMGLGALTGGLFGGGGLGSGFFSGANQGPMNLPSGNQQLMAGGSFGNAPSFAGMPGGGFGSNFGNPGGYGMPGMGGGSPMPPMPQ